MGGTTKGGNLGGVDKWRGGGVVSGFEEVVVTGYPTEWCCGLAIGVQILHKNPRP